jgi:hypothetical protein
VLNSNYINNTDSTISFFSDSLLLQDSIHLDNKLKNDSNKSKGVLDSPIMYNANDSILFSLDNKKVFLYGQANIEFQDMKLAADYIELDMDKNMLYAIGLPDTADVIRGNPVFTEDGIEYKSKEMKYNFETKKGVINEVITEQSDGYLHAEKIKKHANGEICAYHGKYTTCDASHPHFYLALTKAKDLPEGKIVSGPAYMVIEDVPFYFPILPFGFFPKFDANKPVSGLIIPEYGEENQRGFFLRNGGYYFAISDYLDWQVTGDIYTKGTVGGTSVLRYKKRYRYTGRLNVRIYSNASGDRDISKHLNPQDGLSRKNDFSMQWSHSQDPKSNPYSSFNASANLSTSSFNENYVRNADQHLNSTKTSNVSYTKKWPNKPFNLSANLRHSQNSRSKTINFTLPSINFNVSRQYPFRKKEPSGKLKWYEKIQTQYSSRLEYRLNSTDSLFFNHFIFEDSKFGFSHDIPLSVNYKFLKFLNFSPNIKYSGRLYTKKIEKDWV